MPAPGPNQCCSQIYVHSSMHYGILNQHRTWDLQNILLCKWRPIPTRPRCRTRHGIWPHALWRLSWCDSLGEPRTLTWHCNPTPLPTQTLMQWPHQPICWWCHAVPQPSGHHIKSPWSSYCWRRKPSHPNHSKLQEMVQLQLGLRCLIKFRKVLLVSA